MLSIYCTASMLPCGRYYYAPEGGYVGNPWVKFSYQYAYMYLAWIVHHLDLVEHYGFRFAKTFVRTCLKLYDSVKKNFYRKTVTATTFNNFNDTNVTSKLTFSDQNYHNGIINTTKQYQNHQYNTRTMQVLVQSFNNSR
jgi:hypothetical protein